MQTGIHRSFTFSLMFFLIVWWPGITFAKNNDVSKKDSIQEAIAIVNGSVIPKAMLEREIHDLKERYVTARKELSSSRLSEIRQKTVEQLIDNELLYQESQKQDIEVDDKRVQAKFELVKGGISSGQDFQQWLADMNLTEKELKAQIRRKAAINAWVAKVTAGEISVSEKELKQYYEKHLDYFTQPERVRVSHILIKSDPEAEEAQKQEAIKTLEKIQSQLKEGKHFSVLAKKYSQCSSAGKGGDLGYLLPGFMPEPFEKVALDLEPNTVSGIIETGAGYHLIKVTEKQPESTMSFDKAKETVRQYVEHEKKQEKLAEYIAELRKEANIKKFPIE